jgi:arylsulfatase A-like enzyme
MKLHLLLLLLLAPLTSLLQAAERPNIVVILTDDQGWGDLSIHGNTNLNTPNIDTLATQGMELERFYVCPICSPTRAEFMTGRYNPRTGVRSASRGEERMDLDERTIFEDFKAAGYTTAAFGKWHNGMQPPYHPNARGIDEYYGFCSGHWGSYYSPMLEHNGKLVQGKGYITDDFTTRAMDFIEAKKDDPFFVYLPLCTPHSPMQVPEPWWNKFANNELPLRARPDQQENLQHSRAALAMVENIDWNVGRLMESLEKTGKIDDTIVVYFSDNGPNGIRWNGDMKGRKGSTDEGGVRSPCLVRWSRRIPAGKKVSINGAAIDLHPTLAALAGIRTVNNKPFDGVNIAQSLLGDEPKTDDRTIISFWKGKISAKTGPYRMDLSGALFNLDEDPGQRNNIADRRGLVAGKLSAAIKEFQENVVPGYDKDERPFVIAHPDCANTQIPARDGKEHGGIKRSNKFPNSSFFTNWTSTEDSITWDAEVLADGNYEVEIYYTSPEGDQGSEIELSFNDNKLAVTVEKSHPSELVGAAEDHFQRAESYEQNWTSMNAGDIQLKAGKGSLTLKATKIPGKTVMDFRLMMLRRK